MRSKICVIHRGLSMHRVIHLSNGVGSAQFFELILVLYFVSFRSLGGNLDDFIRILFNAAFSALENTVSGPGINNEGN